MEPFQLGNWLISANLNRLTLLTTGQDVVITPKLMAVLLELKHQREHHGNDPISLEQLIERVWPQRIVADSSVYQAIAQLRKALANDQTNSISIERISGKGYRLNESEIQKFGAADVSINSRSTNSHQLIVASAAGLLLVLLCLFLFWPSQDSEGDSEPFFEPLSLAKHLLTQTDPAQLLQAKEIYLEVLAQAPDEVQALNGLCSSYRLLAVYHTLSELDRDNLCQPLLDKAYELEPNNSRVIAAMAKQAFESGRLERAEQLFLQSLQHSDDKAYVWHWYGRLKREQNQIEHALSAHKKAFKLAPNDPIILRGLAYAYLNNRDLANARKYYQRSLIITPHIKNKALYDLDFYPVDATSADRYLTWFKQYRQHYLEKYPAHRLSYIMLLLSLNQGELAQQEYQTFIAEQGGHIKQHFQLYVSAALAWHKGNSQQTLDLLAQRYHLAPEQHHFVMPYIIALLTLGQADQALSLLQQHFEQLSNLEVSHHSLSRHLLLANLYKQTDRQEDYKKQYLKLLTFRQSHAPFPAQLELHWLDLIDQTQGRMELLNQMLRQGWLPDHNDSMFASTYNANLLVGTQRREWLRQLQAHQACIWQGIALSECHLNETQK